MAELVPPPSIVACLESQTRFLLTTHRRPDADAIGSCLALCLALQRMGKQAEVILQEPVPESCRFLPASDGVRPTSGFLPSDQVVGVVLDCGGPPRTAIREEDYARTNPRIVIDHHATNEAASSLHWVVPEAAATGALIYSLLKRLNTEIDTAIATNLYAAIATDTGWFRFANTTPESLDVCATLVRCGADFRSVSKRLFEERSFAATKLMGRALGSLRLDCKGRLVWAILTRQDFADCSADDEETEGIVNHVKGVHGTEVAVLFREASDGTTRVSLRSEGNVDVGKVAQHFGGGGHAPASGCTLSQPLRPSTGQVIAVLRDELDRVFPSGRPSA
ncbi:MAG: hypothetical protein AUJ92_11590 [Armatimonadetes bacterium CG2_30_59_28]|nr:bifunctional oligoribonuclease/PAP phosphatase NrnA [Armatimonadota bacterium]OIO93791.1 MAG: hypothetical protein AUJ92_11590 [Armatimonadetes bacterium CG2_30_59_28]